MSSFPFFAIARHRHIPYGEILKLRASLTEDELHLIARDVSNSNTVRIAVGRAEISERIRRGGVSEEPTFQP